jgi:hypothetical protein
MKRIDFSALPARFREKIIIERGTGCWEWIAGKHGNGYGGYAVTHSYKEYAHRFAWEFFFGPIPQDLQCDHLCRIFIWKARLAAAEPAETLEQGNIIT